MPKMTIYQKPTCSTCSQALQLIRESGIEFSAVNYYETPFTKTQFKELLTGAGLKARDVLRTKEEIYTQLKLGERTLSDDELIDLMLKHPDLIQRPIVQRGEKVLLARPAESVQKLLSPS